MADTRRDIEAFVRGIVAEIEAAEASGAETPQDIAYFLNLKGITTRKGRTWNGATVTKFLSSPGAQRYRAGAGREDNDDRGN